MGFVVLAFGDSNSRRGERVIMGGLLVGVLVVGKREGMDGEVLTFLSGGLWFFRFWRTWLGLGAG